MKKLEDARIIRLPRIYDPRGNLTFVQNGDQYHVGKELLVAISGSFNVNLYDGETTQTFTLNRPFEGLYIPAGYWRTLDNFASGSVCMVLTSTPYSEDDYVRDFEEFEKLAADE